MVGDPVSSKKSAFSSRRAITLAPDSHLAWGNLGTIQGMNGELEGAHASLSHSIELYAGDPRTWSNRGELRRALGDLEGARTDVRRSLTLRPISRSTFNTLLII